MSQTTTPITLTITQELGGLRLDQALQKLMPEHSRSRIQGWIKDGLVTIANETPTAKLKVWGGERIEIIPQAAPETKAFKAENIAIDVVYEDEHILVLNKPAGLVVHPAAGNWEGTLLNALLYHAPQLQDIPRAGIVHRLDKDTSGLLVVAKTLAAQTHLVRQLQARTVKREYRTIVWGQVWRNGRIDQPIGRHSHARTKMAINRMGKPAVTQYEVLDRFSVHTYMRCMLETGRTHQIRVHMQYLKAPIVGDPVYGIRGILPLRQMSANLRDVLLNFKRQALHAIRLGLIHPATGEAMEWQVELAADMKMLLEAMRQENLPQEEAEPVFVYEYDESEEEDEGEEWLEEDEDVE
ncbi:23S rRNA pseudouridine(1911/1915/1917) synthase RluD [Methylobacillus gramineus]|uniref:23S rRNA pseudouridine(1911/1915/1917) synthase RluD n=1 Tax=Methylobacillus gramineus TaxID=755169 RepID=UPI001CFFB315|nr:23S rRNA pseudouridine(1911/1915/1917) synthase RluD [Methylobacillus gramineus]MCB5184156.1 23S rRNA pseudouridine(1911/1915/1917) synthase RluD [Methylobacillus gramineus]